jgi:hypothetical protein
MLGLHHDGDSRLPDPDPARPMQDDHSSHPAASTQGPEEAGHLTSGQGRIGLVIEGPYPAVSEPVRPDRSHEEDGGPRPRSPRPSEGIARGEGARAEFETVHGHSSAREGGKDGNLVPRSQGRVLPRVEKPLTIEGHPGPPEEGDDSGDLPSQLLEED